jgi:hypothetical protein
MAAAAVGGVQQVLARLQFQSTRGMPQRATTGAKKAPEQYAVSARASRLLPPGA